MVSPKKPILDATLVVMLESGLGRLTLEQVAYRAGISRQSIYRVFPGGKDQLIREVVDYESNNWLRGIAEAIEEIDDLEQSAVKAVMIGYRSLKDHQLLKKILQNEQSVLMPILSKEAVKVIANIELYLMTRLIGKKVIPNLGSDLVAEHFARMFLSIVAIPGKWNLEDEAEVKQLVRAELLAPIIN